MKYWLVNEEMLISWLIEKSPDITGQDGIPYIKNQPTRVNWSLFNFENFIHF